MYSQKNKIFSFLLVILWMFIIFLFSNFNGEKSHNQSTGIIGNSIKITCNILYKIKLIDNPLNQKEINQISEKLNYPIRKCMHMSEYFILALLTYNALRKIKIDKIFIITLLVCIIYASSDEIHQLFTGRTGSILDVFIDTLGSLLALLMIFFIRKKRQINV